jgi:hypothetical protein
MVTFRKALEASYKYKDQAKNYLVDDGYNMDDKLSSANTKVFYNPNRNDLLITYRGSKNLLNDWLDTDLNIPFGNLKNTKRYKESYDVYKQAKEKYKNTSPLLIGDSLGGSLASAVGGDDKRNRIYTFNKGAGLLGKDTNNKVNEHAYRQNGDLVSTFSLFNKHKPITLGKKKKDPIASHNINNLRKFDIEL